MIYKKIKTAIILLAAFATGCECSNKEEPGSRTPGSNAASSPITQTSPPSSSQYILKLLGLKPGGILGDGNQFSIKITKRNSSGTFMSIDDADLTNLALTATNNVNDGTAATLQGVDPFKLVPTDIKKGKIEKLITINRGTAETTFTITLTHTATTPVTSTATVVAPSSLFDVSITLQSSLETVHTYPGQKNTFDVDITSKGAADVDVSQLSGITLQYNTNDASNSLSYMIKGKPNSVPVKSGVTTLKAILEQNGVKKLTSLPTSLKFCCEGTKYPVTITNIKLAGTAAPDKPTNYIPSITYTKPYVSLLVKQLPKGSDKNCTLILITTDELQPLDLQALYIAYEIQPAEFVGTADLLVDGSSVNGVPLSSIFKGPLTIAVLHDIACTVVPGKNAAGGPDQATTFKLKIKGSADETPVDVIYTP